MLETEKIHILHVDDDPEMLEISALILSDMHKNLVIDSVCSVERAFAKLASQCYDVIVSDYEMSNTTGLDFLKDLREKGNQTPFILFTGKGREEVAIHALNLGANYYIKKQGSPDTVYGELVHGLKIAYAYKKAEKIMVDKDSRYRALVDSCPIGIAVFEAVDNGEDFVIKDLNPAALQIERITRTQTVGKRVTEVFPGFKNLSLYSIFQQVWRTGQSLHMPEALHKDTNKAKSWCENWVYKLPNNEIVAIYQDITAQKKTEFLIKEDKEKFSKAFKRLGETEHFCSASNVRVHTTLFSSKSKK
jgi:CheY-like chemotaxis protein